MKQILSGLSSAWFATGSMDMGSRLEVCVPGFNIPRSASAVALGDLAQQAELAESELQSLPMGGVPSSGMHSETLAALQGLPPGALVVLRAKHGCVSRHCTS